MDWKDTSIPKWFSIPETLVKVNIFNPLCPRFKLTGKNGETTWISFKYEKLATLFYDCGIIGHDRGVCSSEEPVDPDLYGLWIKYDEKEDIPTPKIKSPTQLPNKPTKVLKKNRNGRGRMKIKEKNVRK